MSTQLYQIFILSPYQKGVLDITLITPQPIDQLIVKSAWSYAVRYTAKGLDLPDYDEALKLMLKRHPTWKIIASKPITIPVDLTVADNDESEIPRQ